ncbi:hypothetical protein [Brevifollis gellanilyticus]|uniref:Lipoprotein n=1 Tax=Brevifollis gellanilyticus TaxID=748831 RepID=A0A512M679_9BACT|nr:hypothetical protein [Brevifollis gellanilyticus]GEP42232.1 hypothetical protein BGE01nite_15230 [Brevifollis gellanilyticus]
MLKAIIQNIHHGMSAKRPAFLMLSACLLLSACGKKEAVKTAAEAPKPAAVSDAKIDAEITDALNAPTPNQTDVQAELEGEAEDILAKYPNKTANELLNVPEVNAALKVGLTKLGQEKRLQDQINNSAQMVAKMKGLSGDPGTVGIDMDIKNYNHDQKSRMLQAVLSEDPKQIVSFITGEVGEAVPELTLEGAARASNGVAIRENPAPAK